MTGISYGATDIAVVGMAGRFPGARTVGEYWANLRGGVESIVPLTEEQLRAAGVRDDLLARPDYVRAAAPLADMRCFDGELFGFSARESAILDPQHRQFLEVCWEALEHAGHDPARWTRPIGIFAGSGHNAYMPYNLLTNPALVRQVGLFLLRHTGNDKDFLATRASYLLDLRGPGVNVQTACSTSLVAIHLAVQSLLAGECDMALAGGVTVELPHGQGYLYQEGEILSPDGHCRSFDASSKGTVFGSGAGVVVLRRLEDAQRDGDTIHAVIKGTAVNNDGAGKVSYLAPSVEGQARCISEALAVAGVEPDDVGYVECHGTGTPVGDPIEVAALTQAFRAGTDAVGTVRIGSVKSNIGHLDTAAGVASFIKVVETLKHGEIPASLHFRAPNPACQFETSPFVVNPALTPWPADRPRIAGVSSLGVGGTNAHVIVAAAPPAPAPAPSARRHQLLVVSGRTRAALDRNAAALAAHLRAHPDTPLADAAWTLQTGRRALPERRVVVARDVADAAAQLAAADAAGAARAPGSDRSVAFLFAGGGAQYPGMGAALYEAEPVFREVVDECLALLRTHQRLDLRPLLFPAPEARAAAARELEKPSNALPALFTVQVALARLWESWGIAPSAMIGHSMGEYSAAHLAGVFSLADGLALVHTRGVLFETLPEGAMLSVPLSAEALAARMPAGLSIAAVNGPSLCVASGPVALIDELQRQLATDEVDHVRVRINVAAHSAMLEPILERFRAFVRGIRLAEPTRPFVSNLSGTWITPAEATDPDYWVRHLRQTVRFADGLKALLADPARVLLEVGPGRTLATLSRQHPDRRPEQAVLQSLRHPDEQVDDDAYLLGVLGRLWQAGVAVDWPRWWRGEARRRIPLPTYQFEKVEHWVEPGAARVDAHADTEVGRRSDVATWGYAASWRPAPLAEAAEPPTRVRVLGGGALAEAIAGAWRAAGADVRLAPLDGRWGPGENDAPDVIYAVAGDGGPGDVDVRSVGRRVDALLHPLLDTARGLAGADLGVPLRLLVVTSGGAQVADEPVDPVQAMLGGVVRVLPREVEALDARLVDVAWPADARARRRVLDALVAEARQPSGHRVVAWRGEARWAATVEPRPLPATDAPAALRDGGVYLITGGLGGIGLEVAEHLALRHRARLVLLGRRQLPARAAWPQILSGEVHDPQARHRIEALQRIEAHGGEVMLAYGDVADLPEMRRVVRETLERFGALHGVIHTAGVLDDGVLLLKRRQQVDAVLAPKVRGTLALHAATARLPLELFVLFSSTSALTGLAGQADYAAANAFLDAFARWRRTHHDGRTVAINWSVWQEVGMAAALAERMGVAPAGTPTVVRPLGHPLLPACVTDTGSVREYAATLTVAGSWLLDDHRLGDGTPLVPGTGYVELMRAAVADGRDVPVELRDLAFEAPCVVLEGQERELRVRVQRRADGDTVTVLSRAPGGRWTEHARAAAARHGPDAPAAPLDVAAIVARLGRDDVLPPEGRQPRHLRFGPRWNTLRRRRLGAGEALLELSLDPAFTDDLRGMGLHPAVLDLATAGAQDLLPGYDEASTFHVPLAYGRVRVLAPLPREVVSHVRLRPGAGADADVAVFDVTLAGRDGTVAATIEEFTMIRVRDLAKLAPMAGGVEAGHARAASAMANTSFAAALAAGIRPAEGVAVFERAVAQAWAPQVIVSPVPFEAVLAELDRRAEAGERATGEGAAGAAYREPETAMERTIAAIARELLGVERLGADDGLEDRGLHSLLAVRLFARLHKATGKNLPIATLIEAKTVAQLAERFGDVPAPAEPAAEAAPAGKGDAAAGAPKLKAAYTLDMAPEGYVLPPEVKPGDDFRSLVPLQPNGHRQPFFVIHARGGGVLNYIRLTEFLGPDRPVWGLQAQGLDGVTQPLTSIEAMAAHYVGEVRTVQPQGPYALGGGSLGGIVALEMAHQLAQQGESVNLLVMFDSWGPAHFSGELRAGLMASMARKLRKLRNVVADYGPRGTLDRVWASTGWLRDEVPRDLRLRLDQVRARLTGQPLSHASRYWHVERLNLKALRVYRPPRDYDGDITLFRALDDPSVDPNDLSMGWAGVTRGRVRVLNAPGTHDTIMKGADFGRMLVEQLEAAEARAAAIAEAAAPAEPALATAER